MQLDARVHHGVLRAIVEDGHAPAAAELGDRLGVSVAEIDASLRRLHDGHGLVLHPGSTTVWIAHPFSLSPTATWVASAGGGWWAPCVWCAMGIVALAAPDATLHTRLGGEAEELRLAIRAGRPVGEDLVVHFALPPRDAWSNVIHYCATVLAFRSAADVDAWCVRHRLPRGAVVSMAQVVELGRAWYGKHLDPAWRKWTMQEAQVIFERVGLSGEFWRLPSSEGAF
jgi:hypothetical protein